jgi:hypothetical protein
VGLEIAIATVALLAVVVAVVSAPLRRARRAGDAGAPDRLPAGDAGLLDDVEAVAEPGLAPGDELEAAREAKYREIRDAELDFRTGKLSREDYDAIDADLRAEAIEILDRIEELRPRDA